MTMLSGSPKRPVLKRRVEARPLSPRSAKARPEAVVPCAEGLSLEVAGVSVVATAAGALWVPEARALIVSDLHLEKGSAFARRGQMLPPYDTRATLMRLQALAETLTPALIVSLGDSFHDPTAADRLSPEDAAAVRRLSTAADFVWIEGNHDPKPPPHLGGRGAAEINVAGLTLRHEPQDGPAAGEVAGHLHPCAAVSARGRRVRARCFATDGARLIMPAFGAYTGGLNVRDTAFAAHFPHGCAALLLARGRVFPAPAGRLLPDA